MDVENANESADKRQSPRKTLTGRFGNLKITNHPDNMPTTVTLRPDNFLRQRAIGSQGEAGRSHRTECYIPRQMPPQRKRTADGAIKPQPASALIDLRNDFLPHDNYRRAPDVRWKMDLDILQRRIAVIEAQKQASSHHRSSPLRARGREQRVGPGQGWQRTRYRQDPETEDNLMDWKEVAIR
ncbi:hypothetical protein AYL99_11095 [Fonsecaea erecta]|uniref:Uncharacterized protein n=1 Tax=Fonsecaea erecta TaxID=1367422 RepID=A0A178Z4I1_9EURO|nr:hypothetical protein AYL99_11095 [Fonsecaea erecta]OAP54647.1 hypothetical protein AYL99_11095 [Fonsecaea erecta]